jgi:hypothetical protein
MFKLIRYLLLLGIIFQGKDIFSQRLGLLPSKTNWQQLRHDSLRVIFPEGHEETAMRAASLMLKVAAADPIDLKSRYQPIDIILQPYTNVANGYVGLAPYVSEFYLQPNENPFELGSLPWADLLALHEFRHVQQVNAMNTGISHLVKVILGERAFTGMIGLASADWYREGDAVYTETKYTPQGRGRLSSFTLPFRERVRNADPWNYYVLRNGSYKRFTPSHYPLGYLMIQYGNHVFGEATWDTIIRSTPRMKPIYDPFSGVVKKYFGKSNRFLYLGAMDYYGKQWKSKEEADVSYPAIPLNEKAKKHAWFDMTFPNVHGDGSIYCVITSFDSTTAIFKISPDGHRERIVSLGTQQDTYFDYSNGKLVWTEIRFDPRWVRKDKSAIVLYDEHQKRKKDIIPAKGYFTPSLDARGNRIVALHTDENGNHHLQLIDTRTSDIISTLPNPQNLYLAYPTFNEEETDIIATARDASGRMCLIRQNIASGIISPITHYSYAVLGRPIEAGPWIFVTSSLGELDEVYAVDKTEGIFYQVSKGNSAHYDPAWDPVQENIIAAQFHLTGKKLVRLPGNPRDWKLKNLDDGTRDVQGASGRNLLAEPLDTSGYEVKKYSPWSNVINFHSWALKADDPVWGIEVISDNILNSVSMTAGYDYNRNNKIQGPYAYCRLGMWFPEIIFGYSNRRRNVYDPEGNEYKSINEEIFAGLAVPLFFSSGLYNQALSVSSTLNIGLSKLRPVITGNNDLNYNYISHRLFISNSRRKAYRQPVPSWGQLLDVSYAHNVSGRPVEQLYSQAVFALPSFTPTNYLLVTGEYLNQKLSSEYISLSSRYKGARGFDIPDGDTNYRLGFTYGFPLLYPDIGFGNIAYLRRIRVQPFFDLAYVDYFDAASRNITSAGVELLFDFQFEDTTIGLRYIRQLQGRSDTPNQFEFFIHIAQF